MMNKGRVTELPYHAGRLDVPDREVCLDSGRGRCDVAKRAEVVGDAGVGRRQRKIRQGYNRCVMNVR